MNIWTLEHEKQEHIMFYTIEKWDIAYTLSFDGTSLKFTPIIIRNHIHMLITLVLFIIRLCAFLVKRLPMFCFLLSEMM